MEIFQDISNRLEGGKKSNDLGNDVFTKCKMGPAVPAAIDLPLEIHHKQPPHAFLEF